MVQQHPIVAFLGPKASYTHQAALDCFNESEYTLTPQISIEDVFEAVQSGTAYRGVVPFENSTNGSVVFTLDLFVDLPNRYPDILVCAETYIGVNHCLLGYARRPITDLSSINESPDSSGTATPTISAPNPAMPRTVPLTDLKHIKKLYSHPQAWGQCKAFLSSYLKGVERQDVSSTSKAAELVAQDKSGTTAAISSSIAAKIHHLDFLAKGIEDSPDNTTRFFILKKFSAHSSPSALESNKQDVTGVDNDMDRFKTLVSFSVDDDDPGALAESLAVFKPYKLNLTSINARPSGIVPWNYLFFVEIKGRRMMDNKGAVNAALRDLGKTAKSWRWLGSWESRLVR
ncbi:prephenate dehydratase [Lepidopterella palustris CBS 459.81]|uniref:prephenate dehydratase n=1 Tax=Lepidopterella palustris CBS 459.81 TaxID=1314670 RepID=A0A8E2EEY0_9PEZI|nr:prephenate dehydratase [Lepidopterella palustris CBS 459.81]